MSTHTDPMPRLDVMEHAAPVAAAMMRVEERIELPGSLRHLIKLRASQINGCAHCLDMHWTHAEAAGETAARLAQLAAHAESPFFSARERALLALTDAVTLVADTGVPDEVWEQAREHLDDHELTHAVAQIAAINFWNRVAVSTRARPEGAPR